MLDELWLRACRNLVQRLEACGLWLADEPFNRLREERNHAAAQLLETLLVPALGEDATALGAERVFGVGNFRLRARLPLSLAFGHDLATQIFALPGAPATRPEAAELAALFNVGIALLDRTIDTLDADGRMILKVLDEERLCALIEDANAHSDVTRSLASMASVEARIVLRVVSAFFARLHACGVAPPAALLLDAYRAEIACARGHALTPRALREVAREKSLLPFTLIGRLTREDGATDALANRLGMVFCLLDDLVDLLRDIESGDPNGIVLQAPQAAARSRDERERVQWLLDGKAVEESVETICENLSAAQALAPSINPLTLMYVRNWIPRRIFAGRIHSRV